MKITATDADPYHDFLATKALRCAATGIDIDESEINDILFPFQRALVRWAVRRGRAALFADTGLGKTFMQLEWARMIGGRVLILAPLSVARQTESESRKLAPDYPIRLSRDGSTGDGITVTNYEQAGKFAAEDFGAIVLDESSILKAIDGKTKARLIAQWQHTPFRLCCTATPAPNDITEIANHAEFLGVMTRQAMLSAFFLHDSSSSRKAGWRLKGHARDPFFRWLVSWAVAIRRPSDLGFDDTGYDLPDLSVSPDFVVSGYRKPGHLIFTGLDGIQDRIRVRKSTAGLRVARTAELVNADRDQWLVWCGLNDESTALAAAIPDAVEVKGADSEEKKADELAKFAAGETRVLVTKTKIAGFGMNFQRCHKMAFCGLSDSWEGYYQAIRRCWRFGQKSDVDVYIVISDAEREVYENVMKKEHEARNMSDELIKSASEYQKDEVDGRESSQEYETSEIETKDYRLILGDSCERLSEIEDESIDLSIFSPPFGSLYTYSPIDRDLGNCSSHDVFMDHFQFVIRELMRVVKAGRLVCCHCQQLPTTKQHDGFTGLKDFRGDLIRAFVADDWIYHGEVAIDKDPQAQAIRTKAKGLLFVTKNKDSSWLRPAFADYILVFRKPGENAVPIKTDVTNEEWITFAHPIWYGIRESETIQFRAARDPNDERHICPLQLETIRRCVRLYSNKGETILSPFAGIGSEGYVACKESRKFVGVELKPSYFRMAHRNIESAIHDRDRQLTFDL